MGELIVGVDESVLDGVPPNVREVLSEELAKYPAWFAAHYSLDQCWAESVGGNRNCAPPYHRFISLIQCPSP